MCNSHLKKVHYHKYMYKKDKKILITGGSKGIGLELVKYFCKNNFSVTVLSRTFEEKN